MPSGRLASPTAGRRRPPEANRTDITEFTKEKEKEAKKKEKMYYDDGVLYWEEGALYALSNRVLF